MFDDIVQMSALFLSRWVDHTDLMHLPFHSEIGLNPPRKPIQSVSKSRLPSKQLLQYTIHFPRIKVSYYIHTITVFMG
jgi:hypothetical protein